MAQFQLHKLHGMGDTVVKINKSVCKGENILHVLTLSIITFECRGV